MCSSRFSQSESNFFVLPGWVFVQPNFLGHICDISDLVTQNSGNSREFRKSDTTARIAKHWNELDEAPRNEKGVEQEHTAEIPNEKMVDLFL